MQPTHPAKHDPAAAPGQPTAPPLPAAAAPQAAPARRHSPWRPFVGRRRLWSSLGLGAAVWGPLALLQSFAPTGSPLPAWLPQPGSWPLLAWNAFAACYLLLVLRMAARTTPQAFYGGRGMHVEHEGRAFAVALLILGAAAVLFAAAREMRAQPLLSLFTLASAWLVAQTVFALEYAHAHAASLARQQPPSLIFPGQPPSGFGDYFYVACSIGTSGQTADVAFGSPGLRRLGAVHAVLSFAFNTGVLAIAVSNAGELLKR